MKYEYLLIKHYKINRCHISFNLRTNLRTVFELENFNVKKTERHSIENFLSSIRFNQ